LKLDNTTRHPADRTMILTLKSNDELLACRAELNARNLDFSDPARARFWRMLYQLRFRMALPPADVTKSWDVANAVRVLEEALPDRSTPVLDMGCFNSEVVYALNALGYRNVHGCDLNPLCRWLPYWNRVKYTCADLTKTPYPDQSFGALTCLSVIEHGVPVDAMAAEVDRLLRPGGIFIFTTDFDASGQPHEIDPKFRLFGQSWRIFTPESLDAAIGSFCRHGLSLLDPSRIDRQHADRPVHWKEQEYTFTLVALRKAGGRNGDAPVS
jgi:SAM-dependent methyltransferase